MWALCGRETYKQLFCWKWKSYAKCLCVCVCLCVFWVKAVWGFHSSRKWVLSKRRTWVYNLKCTTYWGHNMALGELFHIASLGYPTFEMVGQHCLPPGVKREDSVTQCMSTSQHASILSKVLLNFLFFFPHYFYYDYNSLPSSSFSLLSFFRG